MDTENTMRGRLFDAPVRIDMALWLPALTEPDRETVEDILEYAEEPLFADLPWWPKIVKRMTDEEEDEMGTWEVLEARLIREGKGDGFLFKASTPVKTPGAGGSMSYSWGHLYQAWLYAPDVAAMGQKAIAWAASLEPKSKRARK